MASATILDEISGKCEACSRDVSAGVFNRIASIDEKFIGELTDILDSISRDNPLAAIDEIPKIVACNKSSASQNSWYNTYPFGAPSDLFPRFLAVCRGKDGFDDVFHAISTQSHEMAEKFPNKDKTAVLLTDKWDGSIFKKYRREFLDYAWQHRIWYIFILATDHAYTQIPFLSNSRDSFNGLYINTVWTHTLGKLKNLLQGQEICYYGDRARSYKFCADNMEWDSWTVKHCHFSLRCCRWTWSSIGKYTSQKALHDFLENIFDIVENCPEKDVKLSDSFTDKICFSKKTIYWDRKSLDEDERIKKLNDTVASFIQYCGVKSFYR